jgi:hypothetical protein
MLHSTGSDDIHALAEIVACEVAPDLVGLEAHHRFRRAENGAADRLVGKGGLGELVEDDVVGRVVGCADFLKDDALFALQFVFLEGGLDQDIGENVDRERDIIAKHAGVIGCGFGRRGGIDFAADILDLLGDVARRAAGRALEGHMLKKMGDTMLILSFVAGTRLDPDAESDALQMRHGFSDDGKPRGEPGYFNIHRF